MPLVPGSKLQVGRVCEQCGVPLTGRQRRWCSQRCSYTTLRAGRTCQRCGVLLTGRQRQWCSQRCRQRPPDRVCEQCGALLTGRQRRWCSQHCSNTILRFGRVCEQCGVLLTGRQRQWCSPRCFDINRGTILAEPLPLRICAYSKCDVEFRPQMERQHCCCEKHGKDLCRERAYAANRAAGLPAHGYEPYTDRRKENYHRRRALKKGASTGNPVYYSEIAERDGWICQLCHEPVDPDLRWPDLYSGSQDHVIPLIHGGIHDPSNVQLAHLTCNCRKHARLPGVESAA